MSPSDSSSGSAENELDEFEEGLIKSDGGSELADGEIKSEGGLGSAIFTLPF